MILRTKELGRRMVKPVGVRGFDVCNIYLTDKVAMDKAPNVTASPAEQPVGAAEAQALLAQAEEMPTGHIPSYEWGDKHDGPMGAHGPMDFFIGTGAGKRLDRGEAVPALLVELKHDEGVIQFISTETVWLMNDEGGTIEGYHGEDPR